MVSIAIDHAREHNHTAHASPPLPGRGNGPGRPVIPTVTVNGETITRKAIAAEMQNHGGNSAEAALRQAATALIVRALLLQEARRLDVAVAPEVDAEGRRETDEEALIRALVAAEVTTPTADDAELRRYYDNNRRRFVSPPLFEVEHILFAARHDDPDAFALARERADAVRAELIRQPQRFAEFARQFSDCPSASVGGSLGQIGPGDTTPAFEAALFALAPGELSSPVETHYGVHLIRLDRRIDGAPIPFEAVRERLAVYLADRSRRRATAQYIGQLIGRATIDGFDLDGSDTPLAQ